MVSLTMLTASYISFISLFSSPFWQCWCPCSGAICFLCWSVFLMILPLGPVAVDAPEVILLIHLSPAARILCGFRKKHCDTSKLGADFSAISTLWLKKVKLLLTDPVCAHKVSCSCDLQSKLSDKTTLGCRRLTVWWQNLSGTINPCPYNPRKRMGVFSPELVFHQVAPRKHLWRWLVPPLQYLVIWQGQFRVSRLETPFINRGCDSRLELTFSVSPSLLVELCNLPFCWPSSKFCLRLTETESLAGSKTILSCNMWQESLKKMRGSAAPTTQLLGKVSDESEKTSVIYTSFGDVLAWI